MKIVLLHYAAPPVIGGVETVLGHHACLMAQDGHSVRIIAGRGGQTADHIAFIVLPEADSRHPEVLALKAELDAGRVPAAFESFVDGLAARLLELTSDADRVIAHNVCSLNKNLGLTAALHRLSEGQAKFHTILWHHDLAWTTARYRSELHDGYPWDLLRTDWPHADQVVVSAQRRRELAELLRVPGSRIQVIPNGLDVQKFLKLEPETDRLRQQLGLSVATPLLLLPVRITPRKNIELALHVLAELHREFENPQLVITGPLGPHNPANAGYFEKLLALRAELHLQGSAHFLVELVDHPISDEVMADLYRLADALFLPSREEGFGIPILEAGLSGIPVFCSDIESLRELGDAQVVLFSLEDAPSDIARQISSALQASQVFGLRKRVQRDYTWEQIYRNHIAPLLEKGG